MRRGPRVLPILGVGLAGAGAALAVAVYLLSTEGVPHAGRWAALALLTSWSFVGSGVLAWIRRPASRIGPLMIATGVALLARPIWPVASSPALYTATLAIELVGSAHVAVEPGPREGRARGCCGARRDARAAGRRP